MKNQRLENWGSLTGSLQAILAAYSLAPVFLDFMGFLASAPQMLPQYLIIKMGHFRHQQMEQMQHLQHSEVPPVYYTLPARKCPSLSCCFHAQQDIGQFLGQCLHTAG